MSGLKHFLFYWLLLALIPTLLHGWGTQMLHSYCFGMFLTLCAYGLDRLFVEINQ